MTASKNIYQLKVTLDGSKPPIWRRLLVPGNVNLYELHAIIQLGMGWTNSHLHMFRFGEEIYGDPQDDDFGELGFKDETHFRLDKLASQEGIKFQYEYDFGDSWDHSIQVEKILPAEKGSQFPLCIAGKRARPPEDVGGIGGYELFLQAIVDPNDEEHDEYLEWAGGSFDPEKFDLEEINEALRHYKRFSEYMLDEDSPIEETEEGLHKLIAWVQSLSKEQVNQFEMLALRRDMLAFLSYLGENRVTGTQSTGNLPLKAVRDVCAKFVDPPILDHSVGKYTFRLRTEDDVWPLIFIHTLAHVSGMLSGGPARRWRVTEEGQQFPQLPAPVQVAFLLQHWWHRVNWAICFQFSGLGDEPPAGFNQHTLACLLELPAGKALSYEVFADRLIGQSGLLWPIQNQVSARNTLHSAIESMVVDPLVRFGVVDAGYLSKTSQLYRSPELDTICLTQAGKGILGLL